MSFRIIKREITIEKQIDDFLDKTSESALLYKHGVNAYLEGNFEIFKNKHATLVKLEHEGDTLRRTVEEQLYSQTLIPESRGDVLELLENIDQLLDRFKGAIWRLDIERPVIPSALHTDFMELVAYVSKAVEAIIRSSRAFFKNIDGVADHLHKVSFWETECDKVSTRLQTVIFRSEDLTLSQKMHIRDFVRHMDRIADVAEDVADRLAIYVIKRSL